MTLVKLKRYPHLRKRLEGCFVRIWSGEWRTWWRPGGSGYTGDPAEAGLYTIGEALERSGHCDPSKQIEYQAAEPEYVI